LAAGVTYLVRRWAIVAALVAAATTGALAILCIRLPLDRSAFVLGQEVAFGRPVVIVGRNLALNPAGQVWLAFIFILATALYLFAWRISQGRSFFAFSLAILSLYALITLLQTFSLAVLVFAISVTLAVFMIQRGKRASLRGAQRYLLVTLLSVPLLLAASWLVEQSLLSPENAEMARQALLPTILGFGLLLAVFPFGTWMPALAADAPPMVTAFIFAAGQAMALFLVFVFVRDAPWTLDDPTMRTVVQLAGLVMAAIGGTMAAVQRDFGHLLGYAALSDLGYLLLALVAGGSQSEALALLHMVTRAMAITLMAAALAIVRHRATNDKFAELRGVSRRLPIATMGLMIGGLALAGFPLTAGFPTHWAVSRAVWGWAQPFLPLAQGSASGVDPISGEQWTGIVVLGALLVSSIGIAIGLLRGLSAMLGDDSRTDMARQPFIASLMIVILAVLVVILGLYPQLFLDPVLSAAEVFSAF
jgi:formate hydrogenlyase subunit 3/multisubunit Na+/H+ antiporter MnhD subunit